MSFSEALLLHFLEKTGSWGAGRKSSLAPWEAACWGAARFPSDPQGPAWRAAWTTLSAPQPRPRAPLPCQVGCGLCLGQHGADSKAGRQSYALMGTWK